MAKKTKKKRPVKAKVDPAVAARVRFLKILYDYTVKAIDGRHAATDELFCNQADRICIELNKLQVKQ